MALQAVSNRQPMYNGKTMFYLGQLCLSTDCHLPAIYCTMSKRRRMDQSCMEERKALHRHRPFSRLFLPLSRSVVTFHPLSTLTRCSGSLYLMPTPPILQSNSEQQPTPDKGRICWWLIRFIFMIVKRRKIFLRDDLEICLRS